MSTPDPIVSGVQLLVEGNDQRNFFRASISRMGIERIQIQDFGGVNELAEFLKAMVNMDEFRDMVASVGIVRDAEASARSAFQSVQSSLGNASLPGSGSAQGAGGRLSFCKRADIAG